MMRWASIAGLVVATAGSVATGVAVGGQSRVVEPEKVIIANKSTEPVPVTAIIANRATEPVPVTAVVTQLPVIKLAPDARIELGPETMARLKEESVVRLARAQWEYRELRIPTSPGNYSSVLAPLSQAGGEGWETTGLSFSDSGATVIILKRPR